MDEKLKETQCKICLKWYDEKYIKDKICRQCEKSIESMPSQIYLKSKMEYLKNVKLNKKPNKLSSLSKEDKAAFLTCSHCEWLRKIDYMSLKIYCSKPNCDKGVSKNF